MNKERLLQLADHLEKGQLGHKVFDFTKINRNVNEHGGYTHVDGCGTNGCACGEIPFIWPERFAFLSGDVIDLETRSRNFSALEQWMGINEFESEFLFVPRGYVDMANHDEDFDDSILLAPTATKEQVAERIRMFVEKGGIYE